MAIGINPHFVPSGICSRNRSTTLQRVWAVTALLAAVLAAGPIRAEEHWTVRSGQVVFNFNESLLNDIGIDLIVEAPVFEPNSDFLLDEPCWAFPIRMGSDLGFRCEYDIIPAGGLEGSVLRLGGAITLRDRWSGKQTRLDGLEIARMLQTDGEPPGRQGTETLQLRSSTSKQVFFDLVHSMFQFRRQDRALRLHYLNARVTESLARAIARPQLAGLIIGGGELVATSTLISSTPPTTPRHQPDFAAGILDVGLGALDQIQQVGHVGTWPSGTAGLSMATTICNLGTVDVPWLAPMQEDHPLIHMAIYRLLNGRFEQIGVSWMKHGFFATSNSQCTPCQNPSDGTYLAVGCSDTYTVTNNGSRTYLGPRSEVNPYTATWECTGSHFAGGQPDCVRRHGSSGHNAVDHRLVAADADLNNPGATYYYEACYLVHNDQDLSNNWGSRRCTMTWNGSMWNFSTPSSGNALLMGPALGRWGDLATTVAVAADDGEAALAVQTTDLGGGTYHYEYALLNRNSDRQIRSFSIPAYGVSGITNLGFHDNDNNASNDWTVSVDNGVITWQTSTYEVDPNAPALVFGNMMNFRFDANAVPSDRNATLGLFKPGTGSDVLVATRGPMFAPTAVGEQPAGTRTGLLDMRPNPFNHSTTISFELATPGSVKLEIYDAAGRLVRSLIDGGRDAGIHSAIWDGNAETGARAPAGVYHARLRVGTVSSVRSLILVN
jgi:hypothetical protein